jgi:uncharacterized membrane protein
MWPGMAPCLRMLAPSLAPRNLVSNANGADEALAKLEKLNRDYLINLHDAAVVSWEVGKKKPKTHEMHDTAAAGALGGFWGLLFGLIFFIPLLGLAVGAASGALIGSMRDVGISDDFIRDVREGHAGHVGAVRAHIRCRPGQGGGRVPGYGG